MFDDQAFSDASFERSSWLMTTLATVRREVVRMASAIWRTVTLSSRI